MAKCFAYSSGFCLSAFVTSHNLTMPSLPALHEARNFPAGENATTPPGKVVRVFPEAKSQILTVLSEPLVANVLPLGAKANPDTCD